MFFGDPCLPPLWNNILGLTWCQGIGSTAHSLLMGCFCGTLCGNPSAPHCGCCPPPNCPGPSNDSGSQLLKHSHFIKAAVAKHSKPSDLIQMYSTKGRRADIQNPAVQGQFLLEDEKENLRILTSADVWQSTVLGLLVPTLVFVGALPCEGLCLRFPSWKVS